MQKVPRPQKQRRCTTNSHTLVAQVAVLRKMDGYVPTCGPERPILSAVAFGRYIMGARALLSCSPVVVSAKCTTFLRVKAR